MQALVMSQREQQEKEAIAIIKTHAGSAPVGNPIRSKWDYHNSPDERWSHSNDQSVPLVIYGVPAYVDLGKKLDQAAAQTIARALYATPTLDLVPVQHRMGDQTLPNISCERVTVITGAGETLTLTRNHDGIRPDFTHEHSKTTHWQETGCRSITAHLTVTDPDGGVRYADLPMDILCSGCIDVETVWLTSVWTPELARELEELLFLATGRRTTHRRRPPKDNTGSRPKPWPWPYSTATRRGSCGNSSSTATIFIPRATARTWRQ